MPNIKDLTFLRLIMPSAFEVIPRRLFEQIPKRNWSVDRIYEYGPIFISNPFNAVWAMQDISKDIHGVLWVTIDPVVEIIAVNVLSVDREYQNLNGSLRNAGSEIIKKVAEHLHGFQDEIKQRFGIELKKEILWTTTRPRACEKAGAKRHPRTIMEI